MGALLEEIRFPRFTAVDALDILIIAVVIYKLISFFRNTRAMTLIRGVVVIFIATVISRWLGLRAVNWLLDRTLTGIIVALPVVFYPELRRTLEQIGRGQFFNRPFRLIEKEEAAGVVRQIVRAAMAMSATRTGALMVLERETGLGEYAEHGVPLDARVTAELLMNIFYPNSPLHDGAAIIRGNRILAAACFVPLAENPLSRQKIGSRHRAALGISEVTDAVAVVVSEETGIISLAVNGHLERGFDEKSLQERLLALYQPLPGLAHWRQEHGQQGGEGAS